MPLTNKKKPSQWLAQNSLFIARDAESPQTMMSSTTSASSSIQAESRWLFSDLLQLEDGIYQMKLATYQVITFSDLPFDANLDYRWCTRYTKNDRMRFCIATTKDNAADIIHIRVADNVATENIREDRIRMQLALRKHLRANPDLDRIALKAIGYVGGIDCNFQGKSADSKRLMRSINYASNSGVDIDPNFTLDVVNLCDGRDFLRENKCYDLLILGYIFLGAGNIAPATPQQRKAYEFASTLNSALHSEDAWAARIAASSAKFVISFGGIASELTVNVLAKQPSYAVLIPATDILALEYRTSHFDYPDMSAFALGTSYIEQLQTSWRAVPEASFKGTTLSTAIAKHSQQNELEFSGLRRGFFL